jgi:hypothetical protein
VAEVTWHFVSAIAALALLASPLRAQEAPPPHRTTAAEAPAPGEEHANELGAFFGGTSESDDTHFTIGLEYERRLSERLALIVVAEHVNGIDAWVFLAPLAFRPFRQLPLTLYAGPGVETKVPEPEAEDAGSTDDAHETSGEGERETLLVLRAGVGWPFELGRLSVHPQLEVDFAREHDAWKTALVFGVAVGFGF